jgi:hypothetical protein
MIEAAHWAFGAGGGAAFGALPRTLRRRWLGPLYGWAVWLGLSSWEARPFWASVRPSARDRSTALRWAPTACSSVWCNRQRAKPSEPNYARLTKPGSNDSVTLAALRATFFFFVVFDSEPDL